MLDEEDQVELECETPVKKFKPDPEQSATVFKIEEQGTTGLVNLESQTECAYPARLMASADHQRSLYD